MENKHLPVQQQCCTPQQRPTLSRVQAEAAALRFAALADPTRLAILNLLAESDDAVCVCDIVTGFDVSQPTISHHLKILRDAGLILGERRGKWIHYAVVPDAAVDVQAMLARVLRAPVSV